jgi:hypothetical protein
LSQRRNSVQGAQVFDSQFNLNPMQPRPPQMQQQNDISMDQQIHIEGIDTEFRVSQNNGLNSDNLRYGN